jgi:ABC-type branched-subunit amino acid transport system substrate-binding protein
VYHVAVTAFLYGGGSGFSMVAPSGEVNVANGATEQQMAAAFLRSKNGLSLKTKEELQTCQKNRIPFREKDCTIIQSNQSAAYFAPETILVAGLFPIGANGSLGDYGQRNRERLAAAQLAVAHVNENMQLLPDTTLVFQHRDTSRTSSVAIKSVAEFNALGAVAIVGPASSAVAMEMAPVAASLEIPAVSFASTSSRLSSRSDYPFFQRTCVSDALQAPAVADFVKYYNWARVSVLHTGDAYAAGLAEDICKSCEDAGVTIAAQIELKDNDKDAAAASAASASAAASITELAATDSTIHVLVMTAGTGIARQPPKPC